jgi:pimeloyl-ACP methyl ester carboxylesterase
MTSSPGQRHPIRQAVIVIIAAVSISAVAALIMIWIAGLSGSLLWTVIAGLLITLLLSLIIGLLLRRDVLGPLMIFGLALLLSLSWLYPGPGGVRPDPVAGIEWITRPDGSRLGVHVTRASGATQPPMIAVHGGPGVADMAHDAPAFAALATDRDVYVHDRIGTGASTRLTDPSGYTTAREVQDLEAVRVHTGAPQVVLHGHSWGALIVVAYAQEHPDHVAALVLSAPGGLPFGGAQPVAGDLTTRLDSGQKTRLYLQLMRPRNLFAYALTSADARVAHSVAGDRELDRRFARIYRASTPALFCDERLADRVGTNGLGYYAHYVPQLHPDPGDEPLDLSRLAMIKAPVLVIKPACDYLPWSSIASYQQAFPQAKFVMVPGAGHVAYLEQPALYIGLVHAFLAGQQLPLPTTDVTTIPDGYRGTR